jgi:hypothetical protein
VTEIRAQAVDDARGALAALRAQGAQVVHLLEERRQVLRLGHRDVVTELEEARVVGGSRLFLGSLPLVRGLDRGVHRGEQAQLFLDDARPFLVSLETGDVGGVGHFESR